MMLHISQSQKLPISLAQTVITNNLQHARMYQQGEPVIADYYYERVDIALHELAKYEKIESPSFYEKKHFIRSARTPETAEHKELQKRIADVHFERGEVLSRLNQWDKAKAQYEKARKWGHAEAEEALKVLAQRPTSPSLLRLGLHKSTSSTSSAISTFSASHVSTSVPEAERTPAFAFFLKNLPLIPPALPPAGQSLRHIEQLTYCLLLLALDQQGLTSQMQLSTEETAWLTRVKQDQDDEMLRLLAQDMIRAFEKDELKNAAAVAEAVALAPVYEKEDFQKLLNKLITQLSELTLLDFDLLHGLSELIRHAPPESLRTDDLVKILTKLADLIKNTHTQGGEKADEHQYRLTIAINQVLDAMADNQVTDLDREELHQPLNDFFNGLKSSSDPYLVYQAEYARQALAYVPDDETPWQSAWRRISTAVDGTMKFIKAAKAFDLNGFIDGFKDWQAPMGELVQLTLETYERVIELKESGQTLIESLKEGFSFERKQPWYPLLRGLETIPSDQLDAFKQKLLQPELKASRFHRIFLWGVSEHLARVAAHPEQSIETHQQALQWLGELYEDDQTWGSHPIIKQRVVQLIRTLAHDSPVKEKANTLLAHLKTVGDASQQTFYQNCLTGTLNPYPLYEARPQSMALSLLDKVQHKQWLETDLRRFRAERLAHWGNSLYVAPRGKTGLLDTSTHTFDLAEHTQAFLDNSQHKKMALVLGDSGAGKSTFLRFLESMLWKNYRKGGVIPLFIALPTIDNPEQDFIAKHLRRLGLTQAQIKTLKEHRQFVVIADGYDESGINANLYQINQFNQPGSWQGQLIIGCRSQHLEANYRPRFQPTKAEQFQEWVVAPFGSAEVEQYVEQYVNRQRQEGVEDPSAFHWQIQDYQRGLTQIDENFKRTPLLLKTALSVLPRLLNLDEQGQAGSLTRVGLYDEAMKARFEREKQRLQGEGLTDALEDAFNALDEHGFVDHCFQFVTEFAVAIYEKNQGNPVVEYSPAKDKGTWKEAFFGELPRTRVLRKAWPLIRNGNQYRFEHKSFLEYFVTRDICQPREVESTTEAVLDAKRQAATARRGSDASLLSFESQPERLEANAIKAPLPDSLLLRSNLIKEPAIIQFLAERVKTEPSFKQQLHTLIERSKTEATTRKGAANAITILVRAGITFNGADLKGIQIPGADLSGGIFDSAQLQGADMRKVSLRNSWLRQANLSKAKMEGVRFGEWPYLQEEGLVTPCAYSPDGKTCAVGLHNGTISVYNTSSWEKIHTLQGHTDWVRSVVYSPSGDKIASGSWDETVRLWNVKSGETVCILEGHKSPVTCVAYSPDDDQLASGSYDCTVRLWDVKSGETVRILEGHKFDVMSLAYSPDGGQLASGSNDKTVRLWDVKSGETVRILEGHTSDVKSLAYSPDGGQLASGSNDKTVRLWNVKSGETVRILEGHDNTVMSLAYSPDGGQLASGSLDCTVRLWDPRSEKAGLTLQGHTESVYSVAYTPSGDQIVSGGSDHTVRLWDARSWEAVRPLQGHTNSVNSVVYTPGGDQIASGGSDHTVRLWDVESGKAGLTLQGHTDSVNSVVYSPSGRQLASGSADHTVRLWDVESGKAVRTLQGHDGYVESLAYSPNGDQLASGSLDDTVCLWKVESGETVRTLRGHDDWVRSVVYSPSGRQLASGSADHTVRLWDVESGKAGLTLQGHTDSVNSVVYSPCGGQLASGSDDKTVRLWDLESGETVRILEGHKSYVMSLAYSPDGGQLASGSNDKTVRLWDVTSGKCLAVIRDFQGGIFGLAWKEIANRSYLVTGCADKSVRVWQIIKNADGVQVCLHWSSTHHGALVLSDTTIQEVIGLSPINAQLMKQRGATGEPHLLREKQDTPSLPHSAAVAQGTPRSLNFV